MAEGMQTYVEKAAYDSNVWALIDKYLGSIAFEMDGELWFTGVVNKMAKKDLSTEKILILFQESLKKEEHAKQLGEAMNQIATLKLTIRYIKENHKKLAEQLF